jgi:hypothetical protein
MGVFNYQKALEIIPKEFLKVFVHRYDTRFAWVEGAFAVWLAKLTSDVVDGTQNQDWAGIDGWDGTDPVDFKGRKNCAPQTMFIETAAAGKPNTRTGWVFKGKWLYALMIYSENGYIKNVIFGKVLEDDIVKICDEKVDFNSSSRKDVLYQIYHRYFNGEHRGDTTLITYADVESAPSFKPIPVPRNLWHHVQDVYEYNGILD